jgi:uncharacterized protein YkwD
MLLMMIRSLITSAVLSSLVLTTGALAGAANAQQLTSMEKPNYQVVLPSVQKTSPIYTVQSNASQSNASITSLEQAVYDRVNQYRASRGLPPLTIDARISEQARIHSQNMASGVVPVGHEGLYQRLQTIGKVIPFSAGSENVALCFNCTDPAARAVQFWLNSPPHRGAIEGNYNLTGIGVAKNNKGNCYFTQIFIRSR